MVVLYEAHEVDTSLGCMPANLYTVAFTRSAQGHGGNLRRAAA
jgi:hypothetical protein